MLAVCGEADAQSSRRGNKGTAPQQQQDEAEAKTGVRFVICSASNARIKSPLWYKVSKDKSATVAISARTATPRVKPINNAVTFYESDPIPPADEEEAKKWQEPKVVFTVSTKDAPSKAFCIVKPQEGGKVETILLDEKDFPKNGVHLINLSTKKVKIATSEKGDFSDEKVKVLKGGILSSVTDDNKWSLSGVEHGAQLAFAISYEGVKKERKKDKKGKTVKDEKGKPVMQEVKAEVLLRRSKFAVSGNQSQISVLVDDPASNGVKMLSIQLSE